MLDIVPHRLRLEGLTAPAPMLSTPIVFDDAKPLRWEYRVVVVDLREEEPLTEARLAELGADGWLLAGALPPSEGAAAHRIHYYFVRQA